MFKTAIIWIKQSNIIILLIKSQPTLSISPTVPHGSEKGISGQLEVKQHTSKWYGATRMYGEAGTVSPLLEHGLEFTCD